MIFYHFTYPKSLDAILRDGLIASNNYPDNDVTGGKKVIHLTDVPTLEVSLEKRRQLLRRGILCGPRTRILPEATVCLKTVIPTNDRKLKHLRTWLRKHPHIEQSFMNEHWWFYAGNIPARRIEVFKHVQPGVTFWELPELGDNFHAGIKNVFDPAHEDDLLAARAGPEDYIKAHND